MQVETAVLVVTTASVLGQVAQEVFLLSRVVRTFGSEEREAGRYSAQLGILRHISIRQCASYLLYLATNASLFHITKAGPLPSIPKVWPLHHEPQTSLAGATPCEAVGDMCACRGSRASSGRVGCRGAVRGC